MPLLDHRMLVGAVVVEHQMNLDAPVLLIDHLQELEELLVPVPCIHAAVTSPLATSNAANKVAVP